MRKFKVKVDNEEYIVEVEEVEAGESNTNKVKSSPTQAKAQTAATQADSQSKVKSKATPKTTKSSSSNKARGGSGDIAAPLAGVVKEVLVSEGDSVESDQVVLILEAMKMENEVQTNIGGTIEAVKVNEGDSVDAGEVMVVVA